jgi:hypothetical protein
VIPGLGPAGARVNNLVASNNESSEKTESQLREREAIVGMVADAAEQASLGLTLTASAVSVATVEKITSRPDAEGRVLSEDQADALTKIAVSRRMLDVLVGPAGAGSTTAVNALRRA